MYMRKSVRSVVLKTDTKSWQNTASLQSFVYLPFLLLQEGTFPHFFGFFFKIRCFLISFIAEETTLIPFTGRKLTFYRNSGNYVFSFWAKEPKQKCGIDRISANVWCRTKEQFRNNLYCNESDYKVSFRYDKQLRKIE